jgi:hypothetical protein
MALRYLIFMLATSIFLHSCKKTSNDNPTNNIQAGTGDYAPYTLGSTFTYQSERSGQPNQEFTLTVSADTTVDGLVFKKLTSSDITIFPNRYVNFNNNEQREAQFNINLDGYVLKKLVLVNLKATEPLHATWMETSTLTITGLPVSPTANTTHKILSRDQSRQVLNNNFTNVIYVNSNSVVNVPAGIPLPPNTPTSFTASSYYSKGVGLVERDFLGQIIKLKSYTIKP